MATSMRAIKTGTLSFGLVNVPVKLYKAVESHDVSFHQHHAGDCLGAVGNIRVCKDCGEVVDYANIIKGIDVDGSLVTVTAEEFKDLEDEQGNTMEIVQFCDADDVDPIYFDATFYLGIEPKAKGEGYALLHKVLVDTARVGVVRFSLRSRTSLAVLRPIGDMLVLHTLHWGDEIRDPQAVRTPVVESTDKAVAVASMLVESLVAPFDPSKFSDTYTDRLAELVVAKATGETFTVAVHDDMVEGEVDDLLAKLEASIAARNAA